MKSESEKFLNDIQSDIEDVQLAAFKSAAQMDAEVIPPLCGLLVSPSMMTAKAADEALKRLTHSVGEHLKGNRWESVVQAYINVLEGNYETWSKAIALRHLSMIAGDERTEVIADFLKDKKLREEAVFCLERIPGKRAATALEDAVLKADDDFKPRILVALGHRGDASALSTLEKVRQSNSNLVRLAAIEALARIVKKPSEWGEDPSPQEFASELTPTQKRRLKDSLLEYRHRMLESGHNDDDIAWFDAFLDDPEDEHFRCAGITGLTDLAKRNGKKKIIQGAVEKLKQKLQDQSYIVQLTAQKAIDKLLA